MGEVSIGIKNVCPPPLATLWMMDPSGVIQSKDAPISRIRQNIAFTSLLLGSQA
jgi:hypothetical protein